MGAPQKRSDDEKRALLAEWRLSGLSRTAFCKSKGIAWKSLGEWMARLEPPVSMPPNSFVDVDIVPDAGTAPLLLELAGSGHCIVVPSDFDVAALRRLVGALC